jgi:hypothetical protein
MVVRGRCHCGNIAFALDWEPDPQEIPARACDCTFCRKHGGVWTSNPGGRLRVRVRDPAHVSQYTFGTGTADFHVCARCGIVPLVTSEIDAHLYAVVSVNAFEGVDPALLKPAPVTFEGEDQASRLARRKRNWIRDVAFEVGVESARLPPDVQAYVARRFHPQERAAAAELLSGAVLHDRSVPEARLLRCAAVASGGSLQRLAMEVETLKRDYRDVIVEGEYVAKDGELVRVRDLAGPIPADA